MDIGKNIEIINKQIEKKLNFNKELLNNINSLDLEKKEFFKEKIFDISIYYSNFLISFDFLKFEDFVNLLIIYVFFENDIFIEKRIESIFFEIIQRIILCINSKNFDNLDFLLKNFFIFLQVFLFLKKDFENLFPGSSNMGIDFDINTVFEKILNFLLKKIKVEKKLNFFININIEGLKVFKSIENFKKVRLEILLEDKNINDLIILFDKKKLQSFFFEKINKILKNLINRLENEKNIDIREFQGFENIYNLLKNDKNLNSEISLNKIRDIIVEKKINLREKKINEKFSVDNIILESINYDNLFSEQNLNIFNNIISDEKKNFSNFLIKFFEEELKKMEKITFRKDKIYYKINILIFYFLLIKFSFKKLELENNKEVLENLKISMKKEIDIFLMDFSNLDLKNELNSIIEKILEFEILKIFLDDLKILLLKFLGFQRFLPFNKKLNSLSKKDKILYIKNREKYSFLFDCYILDIEAISQNLNIKKLIENFF